MNPNDPADPASAIGPAAEVDPALVPDVVHETTAAIIVVDLTRREVTFANPLAQQLAGTPVLPLAVDTWAEHAGLRDISGEALPDEADHAAASGAQALLRVAAGEPVFGEAVTAAHRTTVTAAREPLWVLGLPMTDAPQPLSSQAIVVFLPMRETAAVADAQESVAALRNRAIAATRMSFTITTPCDSGNALVWANPAFTESTGYDLHEIMGQNLRLLQGPQTDERVVAELGDSIRRGEPITTTLLNYRKDGSSFWNQLSVSPVLDGSGAITHFVGVQSDVSDRIYAERARDAAVVRAESATLRMTMVASFTQEIAATLDADSDLELLARFLVPRVGTWCAMYLLDSGGNRLEPRVFHQALGHRDDITAAAQQLRTVEADWFPESGPIGRVISGELPYLLIPSVSQGAPELAPVAGGERFELYRQLGTESMIVVPLLARNRVLGALAVMADEDRRPFSTADLELVADLAGRTGLMVENSHFYERQRAAAEVLRRSLRPELGEVSGVRAAAAFLTAGNRAAVGGDWYDLFGLADGRVGIVIGDAGPTTGDALKDAQPRRVQPRRVQPRRVQPRPEPGRAANDGAAEPVPSARAMNEIRTILRAAAWRAARPAAVLSEVSQTLQGLAVEHAAGVFYGRLQLADSPDGDAVFDYANAGHLPVVLREPDGATRLLGAVPSPPVAAINRERPTESVTAVPRGSTLVLFTDGLLAALSDERDQALKQLRQLVEAAETTAPVSDLVDQLIAVVRDTRDHEDVAVLAVVIE